MRLEVHDLRPRSLFDRSPIDGLALGSGVAAALSIHVALPLTLVIVLALLDAAGVTLAVEVEAPPPPVDNVIQARFVELGEVLDPNQLPDRVVPILRTDVADPRAAPSLDPNPPPPAERPREPRQRDAVDDALRRLSDDAQVFAERAEERLPEGDPNGVEGGTERQGTEGDLYRGRLYMFFRRGWSVPTTLSAEVVEGLRATVVIEVAEDTRITGFRLARPSGNADFDQSVSAQVQRIIDAEGNIPAPPEEVAAQYLGRAVTLNFHGRDAR